jgi:methylmalonyl-CoA/ethylmalonyl-CoA epimerase
VRILRKVLEVFGFESRENSGDMIEMEGKLKLDFSNLKVDQFGYVYKDIERQARIWETAFNMPKFNFLSPPVGHVNYRGKQADIRNKIGFSRNFNVQIELIQAIEGYSIYNEFLDQGREGLHHFNVPVENIELQIEQFKRLGYEPVQSGIAFGSRMFAYFDFEKSLGTILEIQGAIKKPRKKD